MRTLPQSSLPQSQPGDGGELSLELQRPQAHPAVNFIYGRKVQESDVPRVARGEGDRGSPSPAASMALRGRRRVRQQSR